MGAAALTEPGLDAVVMDLRAPELDGAALRAVLDPATPVAPGSLEDANDATLRRCCSTPAATSARRAAPRYFPLHPAAQGAQVSHRHVALLTIRTRPNLDTKISTLAAPRVTT